MKNSWTLGCILNDLWTAICSSQWWSCEGKSTWQDRICRWYGQETHSWAATEEIGSSSQRSPDSGFPWRCVGYLSSLISLRGFVGCDCMRWNNPDELVISRTDEANGRGLHQACWAWDQEGGKLYPISDPVEALSRIVVWELRCYLFSTNQGLVDALLARHQR